MIKMLCMNLINVGMGKLCKIEPAILTDDIKVYKDWYKLNFSMPK